MPQKRKYETPAALAEEIEKYFESISAEEDVVRTVFDGTDSGKQKYRTEVVLNRQGEPMRRIIWYTPPTIGGLCLYLGISRKTFSAYAARKGAYADAVAHARSVVMAYLEEKISDPDIKNVKGVSLAMETLLSVLEDEKRRVEPVSISGKECAELLREAAECGFIPPIIGDHNNGQS